MSTRRIPKFISATLLVIALLAIAGSSASADQSLESSDPAQGAILQLAPGEARLTFSEPLDVATTSVRLIDHIGRDLPEISFLIESDRVLVVSLPDTLPDGAYSLLYQVDAGINDPVPQGILPFSIGRTADIGLVSSSSESASSNAAPNWLKVAGRWLSYLGLLGMLALWPIWVLVLAPAFRRHPVAMRTALDSVRTLTLVLAAFALIGTITEMIVRAIERDGAFATALETTLFNSRDGNLLIARLLALGLLATLLSVVNWVKPARARLTSGIALIVSLLLALPLALDSNAADEVSGRAFAIVSDVLHLLAAGLWGGGILLLAVVYWRLLKTSGRDATSLPITEAISRFSFVFVSAWIVLLLSGAYASWLQIGNLDAARATSYGNAFLVKLAISVVLVCLGVVLILTVNRRTRQKSSHQRSTRLVIVQAVGIVLVLLATGWMTAQVPARDDFTAQSSGQAISLSADGLDAHLWVSPAAAGPNHFQLTVDGIAPSDSVAILVFSPPNGIAAPITRVLAPVGPNNWEYHGAELSLAGVWQVTAMITNASGLVWQATTEIDVVASAAPLPGQPWRFGLNALAGLAMLVIGALALGRAIGNPTGRSRKETAGIGIAGLAIGVAFLFSARLEAPAAIVLADDATLARGSAIYAQQCLACHGVTGAGDGPEADSLPVPPADFTDPIHQLHSDTSLAIMIQNGFPFSGMPGFADILSAGEIADVIAYVRALGAGNSTVETPAAADCTIAPRDIETLVSITSSAPPATANPASWPMDDIASPEEDEAVGATIRQFVACSNAGDYERVLATESLGYLAPQFAALDDVTRGIAIERAANPQPLAQDALISIESIDPVRRLDDGRLATRVVTLDPINHPHRLEAIVTLIEEDGIWRIDEIHRPKAAPSTTAAASIWPLEVTNGDYTLALTIGDPAEPGRPLRVQVTDSEGGSVDGAFGMIVIVPQAVGIPSEHELTNIDPGVYFTYAPTLAPGVYVLEITLHMPDGAELNSGFTFVLD